ncbi:hypothetical protein EC07E033_20320, partial [Escherichia coli]
HCQYRR